MVILSILIPTIPERHEKFTKLFNKLHRQLEYMQTFHSSLGHIEILVDSTPKFLEGGLSIGKKREALVKRAEGKYLCFLDDDDEIAGNYLETLVRLCQQGNDVVTFRSFADLENYWSIIDMSIKYALNDQCSPEYITRRRPWHVCPVKSFLAKVHDFEDSNYGEDWSWFYKVADTCLSESHTDAVIHKYIHRKSISEADNITKQNGILTIK